MTKHTAPRVSRETIQDRLRMARTTPKRYDDGAGITSSRASRRITRGIEALVNHVIEDGIEGEDERDACATFVDTMLQDIDRQIMDFAYKVENEVRPARWAALEKGA